MKAAGWVGAGAVLLLWPALVNGYPVVFSDTAALEAMGLQPTIGWDKPWVYGPLSVLFHAGLSLWGVALAQALALSAMVWLAGRTVGLRGGVWHGVVCCVLAAGSAVPWFASFIMPDVFAPLTVLSLFLLGWGGDVRRERGDGVPPTMAELDPANHAGPVGDVDWASGKALLGTERCHMPRRVDAKVEPWHDDWGIAAVALLAAIAIASHLTHLVIAAACLGVVLLTRPRRFLLCAAPLAAALAWLVACNAVGNGAVAVSPYGSVFALARLQADGPAVDYLHTVCPQAKLRLCHWVDRLPMDSDAFLWDPDGPMWGGGFGPTLLAPEAAALVRATVAFEPLQVAVDAARNTLRQLGRNRVGDTLGPQYLDATVGLLLRTYFPAAEQARFARSRQVAGTLPAAAIPLAGLRAALLAAGAAGTLAATLAWRRWPALAGLAGLVLAGVLANAFATGALSGPHDRYGARIAWLVLLPPLYALIALGLQRRDVALGRAGDDGLSSFTNDAAEKSTVNPVIR